MSVPPRRPWPAPAIALGLAFTLALALAGCDQPTGSSRPRPRVKPADEVAEAPAPPPAAPVAPRPILNERTQDVRDMEKEKQAGGVVKDPKITVKQAYALQGNAYVSIVSQAATLNIQHAVDLYQAETGAYPKDYAEFKAKIIDANNIALPTLPYYQEYGYDTPNHKLVIMEYPDRKEQANFPK
jgi:hypothetical protein